MIIVDSREFRSSVVKTLFKKGVKIQSLKLRIGDYLIGESVCVERKSVKDFVDSLIDKRIFEQLKELKEEYNKALLIVEGGESVYSVRKVHPNAIRGLITAIVIDYDIPIIFSNSEDDTADYLTTIHNRLNKERVKVIKGDKKVLTSNIQESIVEKLPEVGVKTGESLLKHFKTIKALFNASVSELEEVEGVGKKTAEKIFKIGNKEYKRV